MMVPTMTEPMAVCSCGACRTLMGHTGCYWVCADMDDAGPNFCPKCGDHLLPGGLREPWALGGSIISGLRTVLEWLRWRTHIWGHLGHLRDNRGEPPDQPEADWYAELAAATGVPVEHLTGETEEAGE